MLERFNMSGWNPAIEKEIVVPRFVRSTSSSLDTKSDKTETKQPGLDEHQNTKFPNRTIVNVPLECHVNVEQPTTRVQENVQRIHDDFPLIKEDPQGILQPTIYADKIVEVPHTITLIKPVYTKEVREIIREVPKIVEKTIDKIVEVPDIQYIYSFANTADNPNTKAQDQTVSDTTAQEFLRPHEPLPRDQCYGPYSTLPSYQGPTSMREPTAEVNSIPAECAWNSCCWKDFLNKCNVIPHSSKPPSDHHAETTRAVTYPRSMPISHHSHENYMYSFMPSHLPPAYVAPSLPSHPPSSFPSPSVPPYTTVAAYPSEIPPPPPMTSTVFGHGYGMYYPLTPALTHYPPYYPVMMNHAGIPWTARPYHQTQPMEHAALKSYYLPKLKSSWPLEKPTRLSEKSISQRDAPGYPYTPPQYDEKPGKQWESPPVSSSNPYSAFSPSQPCPFPPMYNPLVPLYYAVPQPSKAPYSLPLWN